MKRNVKLQLTEAEARAAIEALRYCDEELFTEGDRGYADGSAEQKVNHKAREKLRGALIRASIREITK